MAQPSDCSTVSPPRSSGRLIERLRAAIRARHYSRRIEKRYWYWIRWFIRFHGLRHPAAMGGAQVSAFLSHLATERNLAASAQHQPLWALSSATRCSRTNRMGSGWRSDRKN